MKRFTLYISLLLLSATIVFSSCASSKGYAKKGCGCESKKGMVGY